MPSDVNLAPELLASIASTVEQAKALQVNSASNQFDVDQLVVTMALVRNNMNAVHAVYQDLIHAQLAQELKLEAAEKAYENVLSVPLAKVDHKLYRSEGERKVWAEQQLAGTPVMTELYERRHRVKAIEMLVASARMAYENLDKARHDIQTIVALLSIKYKIGQERPR